MDIHESKKAMFNNVGILALGALFSKAVSFLLLPLYTMRLATDEYGMVDVLYAIAALALPFISLELGPAVFRFLIDQKNRENIISTAVWVETSTSLAVVTVILIINRFCPIKYCELFIFYMVSNMSLIMCQNIARGVGDNKLYSLMSLTMSVVSGMLNLVLILLLNRGADAILLADSVAFCSASAVSIFHLKVWRYIRPRDFSAEVLKEMLLYSLPLIPSEISWWVMNTSDRLIILRYLGSSYNGLYAVANKISFVYLVVYGVYNLAWVEAVSRLAGDGKQNKFINEMLQMSITIFGCLTIIIACFTSLFYHLIVGVDYAGAYTHTFILLLAVFVNSMCSFIGGILTAFKKTWSFGKTTVIGAVANIVINLMLIRLIGLYAASISTIISYVIILLLRYNAVKPIMKLDLPWEFLLQLCLMTLIAGIAYTQRVLWVSITVTAFLLVWSVWMNRNTLVEIIKMLLPRH